MQLRFRGLQRVKQREVEKLRKRSKRSSCNAIINVIPMVLKYDWFSLVYPRYMMTAYENVLMA